MKNKFKTDEFLNYLEEHFTGFSGSEGRYLRELTEAIVNHFIYEDELYGMKLVSTIASVMPEVTLNEVAMFQAHQ